ncbi:MAG: hypothetical protein KCHDKBKB_02508 [Elusimicrobia bacterium]|nr:hypothetical protein [Elusimicrobiota bacterium]
MAVCMVAGSNLPAFVYGSSFSLAKVYANTLPTIQFIAPVVQDLIRDCAPGAITFTFSRKFSGLEMNGVQYAFAGVVFSADALDGLNAEGPSTVGWSMTFTAGFIYG